MYPGDWSYRLPGTIRDLMLTWYPLPSATNGLFKIWCPPRDVSRQLASYGPSAELLHIERPKLNLSSERNEKGSYYTTSDLGTHHASHDMIPSMPITPRTRLPQFGIYLQVVQQISLTIYKLRKNASYNSLQLFPHIPAGSSNS